MASCRTLFLAMNASTGPTRLLFLPFCYLVVSSPLLIILAWWFNLEQILRDYMGPEFQWLSVLPQVVLSTVILLLPTRLFSGWGQAPKSKDGKRRVQSLPYWIPQFRHLWSLIFGGEGWLRSKVGNQVYNVFAYSLGGAEHNVVISMNFLDQLYKNWDKLGECDRSRTALYQNAFNLPKDAKIDDLLPEVTKTLKKEMLEGKQMKTLTTASLNLLSESIPDLATFNSSIVDQMQWERVANVELTDGTSESEVDLFALINEFCCNAILPPILGTRFTESYQLLATDLAAFNQRYWALALGMPRLVPLQGLPGAALSKKRLFLNFVKLFNEITNPPAKHVPADDESVSGEETDADIPTPLDQLNNLFTKHDLSMEVRAAIGLKVVHDIVAEVVPLVFWTLLHIYATKPSVNDFKSEPTLERVREETKSWAQAFQPPSIHPSFPAPPEIRFSPKVDPFSDKSFPYLRSFIKESRRLYTCPISTYKLKSAITLTEGSHTGPEAGDQWLLPQNSYVDIGLSQTLINACKLGFISGDQFIPYYDQIKKDPPPASIEPPVDTAYSYKNALLISLVAGIVQLWDISPAPKKSFLDHMKEASEEASMGAAALSGAEKQAREEQQAEKAKKARKEGKWVIPQAVDGAAVKIPKRDIRVRVRRREGLPASNVPGRIG